MRVTSRAAAGFSEAGTKSVKRECKRLHEAKIRLGVQIGRGQVTREQVGIGGRGNHGGVVRGKGTAGEKDADG